MIMTRLKTETKAEHHSLDSMLIPQLKKIDEQGYILLLKTFYGYFLPVEKLIDSFINDSIIPDVAERRKADYLVDDLKALGAEIDTTHISTSLPNIHNIPTALGAMYVLEGSTLGGTIISKMLSQRLGPDYDGALKFYNGYGAETQNKWMAFMNAVNSYTTDPAVEDEMVFAAKDTFNNFGTWIAANMPVAVQEG